MLTKRIARSFRRQDWLAVVIEFVIVVAGIFVGLRVTEWHEQRQLQARELSYLARLHEDLQSMSAAVEALLERAEGRLPATLRTLRALEACTPAQVTHSDLERTFTEYQNQALIPVVDRTYREMVASGALTAMQDRELSGDIAQVFSDLENYRSTVPSVRASMPVIDRVVWDRVELSYDAAGQPTLAAFDFEAMCADRALRNAVVEIYDLVWDWETITRRTAERIRETAGKVDLHLALRLRRMQQ